MSNLSSQTEKLRAIQAYIKEGLCLIPVRKDTKKPYLEKWNELGFFEQNKDQILEEFSKNTNDVGCLLKDSELVDLDFDIPNGLLASLIMNELSNSSVRPNLQTRSGKEKLIFEYNESIKRSYKIGGMELRHADNGGKNFQSIIPPSAGYRWLNKIPTLPKELIRKILELFEWALTKEGKILSLIYPQYRKGGREDIALFLSGALRKAGWKWEETSRLIEKLVHFTSDEEAEQRLSAVKGSYSKPIKDIAGLSELSRILDTDTTEEISKLIGKKEFSYQILTDKGVVSLNIRKEWLIKNFLMKQSINLWGGFPGSFKSYTNQHLAIELQKDDGLLFNKFAVIEPCNSVIIDEETPLEELKTRLELFNYKPQGRISFLHMQGFNLEEDRWIEALYAEIDKINAGLVIIDTLANIHTRERDRDIDVSMITKQLRKIRNEKKVTIIGVYHVRKHKAGEEISVQDLAGNLKRTGDADNVLVFQKKDRDSFIIHHVKSRIMRENMPWRIDVIGGEEWIKLDWWGIYDDGMNKVEMACRLIPALLEEGGPKDRGSLITELYSKKSLSIGTNKMLEALKLLEKDKLITHSEGEKNKYVYMAV